MTARRFPWLLSLLICGCLLLGSGLERSLARTLPTVDPVPERFALGQQLYLEACARCHPGLPPEVLPTQAWQILLREPDHFGVTLPPLDAASRTTIGNYLKAFSQPAEEKESKSLLVARSRSFRALHPRVSFREPVHATTCVSCHPGAPRFDYRSLASGWENSP
jgi:hypothetical protein